MSIRQLKTLIYLKKHGNFSIVAEKLGITHSAVSQQMKGLESEYKCTLFDRSTRSPELNHVGKLFAAEAEKVVQDYDLLLQSALRHNISGDIAIGAVPTTFTGLVPLAMNLLKKRFEHVHVRLQPDLTHSLLEKVTAGALDAAVVSLPATLPAGIASLPVATEKMQLIASCDVSSTDAVEVLKTNPFIRFNKNAVVGETIDKWLQEKEIEVSETMELKTLDAIWNMVVANVGVSIVPKMCVKIPNPLPVKQILLGNDGPLRELALVHRSDTSKNDVIEAVHATLLNAVRLGFFTIGALD